MRWKLTEWTMPSFEEFDLIARSIPTRIQLCKERRICAPIVQIRRFLVLGIAVALGMVLALHVQAADKLRIYVSNEDSGEITVVDPGAGQVLQRLNVGKRPRGIKLSPDGKFLYVALSGSPSAGPEWTNQSFRLRSQRRWHRRGGPGDLQTLAYAAQRPGS